jgi:D-serine dehydratase
MTLEELSDEIVAPTTKGWPAGAGALPLRDAGTQGWSLLAQDLPLPAAVLKGRALAHNSRWMRAFLQHFDVELWPHGKTTMAPQLFARQLADGCAGITVATAQQLLVARRFGVARVLLANQLVGRQNLLAVLRELAADPGFEFLCLVDSEAGALQLAAAARDFGLDRPIAVLLEGGITGGRTGCRTVEQALAVARLVARTPELALAGVEGFEGVLSRLDIADTEREVQRFLDFLVEIARACDREDLFAPGPVRLTAGGSAFFDLVTRTFRAARLRRETRTVLRSGCYLTHDSKMYTSAFARLRERTPEVERLGDGLVAALEVWACVQSIPEPGLAIATAGKRDISYDTDLPLPEQWFRPGLHGRPQQLGEGFSVIGLNDQHAYLRMPADSPLQVGDLVSFGISHPCTTFDKWQLLWVVDDDYRVSEAIRTFF